VSAIAIEPIAGLPEIRPGDDLADLLLTAGYAPAAGDVLAVAHKVISKAEGRIVALDTVTAGERAVSLAAVHDKDPRQVQVVLDESAEIVRSRPGVLICRTRHGFVCANAGVDASNAGAADTLVLLPVDADASARALRAALRERTGIAPAVIVTDSFGRAWRQGQCETAIGIAGLVALDDWRGRTDAEDRELRVTVIAIADEAAAAADLARAKDSREPAIVVRGLGRHVTEADGLGAKTLLRPRDEDLFS